MTSNDQIQDLKIENLKLELEVKKAELKRKQNEIIKIRKNKISFERATILVAIIGVIGSFILNTIQGFFSENLKQKEFESTLITKAVENGDSSVSRKNLKFLLDAGLISDRYGKIKKIVVDTLYSLPEFNKSEFSSGVDFVFINPGGSKYHLSSCKILIDSTEEKISVDKAKELSLQKCKFCDPPDL